MANELVQVAGDSKLAELELLADADARAALYLSVLEQRRVFPDAAAIAALGRFDESLPAVGLPARATLAFLDEIASPATVVSNGPRYFGFVIGAALPVAAAAERLALAWDQCASTFDTSPAVAAVEKVAARWVLEALDLPRESAVGFGTSASACAVGCLAAARRKLLARRGWNLDDDGLLGAPEVRVVAPQSVHITMKKALRLLGFGLKRVTFVPVDSRARIQLDALPVLDENTILCLQAGEVNTGEFDHFGPLISRARDAGTWVHVDGAFGLWARVSPQLRHLTDGVDGADSWTTDGHKWLNTPYDCALAICRDADALAGAMNSDAVYASASRDAQKNLTLEFSRRARGVPVWAALRSLGREGIAAMVERHCAQARRLASGLSAAGYEVLNEVLLNQVIARAGSDAETVAVRTAAQQSGEVWFGPTVWQSRPAFRLSVSSWRTRDEDVDAVIELMRRLKGG